MSATPAPNRPRHLMLLVGATGPTGRQVISQAERYGVTVRALARNPDKLTDTEPAPAEIVRGDVLDPQSLAAAVDGVDSVVSVLGTRSMKPLTMLSEGTANLIAAMEEADVQRLVCITGMGAGDSRGHGGLLYDRLFLPLVLRNVYADKDRQEKVVAHSDLDWTLVRPGFLTNGAFTGRYREMVQLKSRERIRAISRADVADFILREATAPTHHRQAVNLGS